jgi:hypothetical protein
MNFQSNYVTPVLLRDLRDLRKATSEFCPDKK